VILSIYRRELKAIPLLWAFEESACHALLS